MPVIIGIAVLGIIALVLIVKGGGSEHLGAVLGALVPLAISAGTGTAVAGFASVPLTPFIGVPVGVFVAICVFKALKR